MRLVTDHPEPGVTRTRVVYEPDEQPPEIEAVRDDLSTAIQDLASSRGSSGQRLARVESVLAALTRMALDP